MKCFLVSTIFVFAAAVLLPGIVRGQGGESLSILITPPLFQLNVEPGDSWTSSLKVVNTNPYDITVQGTVVGMEARGELGHPRFSQLGAAADSGTLASWIMVPDRPVTVPSGQSEYIPVAVRIPEDAPPGGHYAAILVGGEPLSSAQEEASVLRISSMVSSLFFVRVEGDIREDGFVRSFTTEQTVFQQADVPFSLRFENRGNVHLQPQGNIVITNMWGRERGRIDINQQTHFGNVLPGTVRKFDFRWQADQSLFEAGRYTAVATLTFGSNARQNVLARTHFWVVPVVPLASVGGGMIVFFLVLFLSIRAYVRRVIRIAQREAGLVSPTSAPLLQEEQPKPAAARTRDLKILARPFREGVLDFRAAKQVSAEMGQSHTKTFWRLGRKYAFAFGLLCTIIGGSAGMMLYFSHVLAPERGFEMVMETGMQAAHVAQQDDEEQQVLVRSEFFHENSPRVVVVNASGEPGAGVTLAVLLAKKGIFVKEIREGEEIIEEALLVRYPSSKADAAASLQERIDAEIVFEEMEDGDDIIVMAGSSVFSDLFELE